MSGGNPALSEQKEPVAPFHWSRRSCPLWLILILILIPPLFPSSEPLSDL